MAPNGSWLLFAYLRFAEELEGVYGEPDDGPAHPAGFVQRDVPPVSAFAQALGMELVRERKLGCEAHWGNAGFCVDVAVRAPEPDAPTVGVLCDFARYAHAPDPVEWELFRSSILESLGWDLRRVWTPDYFRDPPRVLARLTDAASNVR
jgi:hypothetical protein